MLIIVLGTACTVPYDFNPNSYEEVLVIEGQLTNQTKSHKVRLSYSYRIGADSTRTINDAHVYFEELDGGHVQLESIGNGEYLTQDSFQGNNGSSYRLVVKLADDSQFESDFITLTDSPKIDSIYGHYATLAFSDQSHNDGGIQFFLDTHDENNVARFFRYEYDETWLVKAPFPSQYDVDTATHIDWDPVTTQLVEKKDTFVVQRDRLLGTCYEYNQSQELNIGTSAGNSINTLIEHPITFVSQTSPKLRSRYSILVRQYAISEDAFFYYRKIKENNESGGTLFDSQTGTVNGNIRNSKDPNQTVLGFFEVSGFAEKRGFFNPNEFEDPFVPPEYRYSCTYGGAILLETDSAARFVFEQYERRQIFGINTGGGPIEQGTAIILNTYCTSCYQFADTVKPAYWTDF